MATSDTLFDIVKANFKEVATPGTIRDYLEREHGKTVDYEAARSLQRRLKTFLKSSPSTDLVVTSGRARRSEGFGQ